MQVILKNKIELLFLFSIMFFWQNSYGQFSVGIEGGVNVSTMEIKGIDEVDEEPFVGYSLGFSPRYSINKITFLADLNYSYRGYEIGNGDFFEENSKFKNTDVIISPQIEYRIQKSIGIGLGLYFGIELEEAQKLPPASEWYSTKEYDIIQSPDYGVNLGLKYYYRKVYLKVLFDFGLKDVLNSEAKGQNGEDLEFYERSILVGVGYLIEFKK